MEKDLSTLRHSTAHVLAQAVKNLFPDVKLAIGPSIENGFYYDFDKKDSFSPEDLEKIEKKMQEIIKKNYKFEQTSKTKKEAEKILKNEPYKLEILKDLKEDKVGFYQDGDFIDLCKGPHVSSTGEIKAFKLLNTAGAYWRGIETNPMLQRIYGTAFYSKKDLDEFLITREEAKKRDHRKLGKELELFNIDELAPGFPFIYPKGTVIINELINFLREEYKKRCYIEVKTPMILAKSLWEKSGHWDHYKNNMYFVKIDKNDYAVKPMNCPGSILVYKQKLHSYRELPIRMAEFGLVHRHELRGVLAGLFRVRVFTQDDAHIYCTEEQIKNEIINLIDFIDYVYRTFKFDYNVELSTRPKDHIGDVNTWNLSEKALEDALKTRKIKYKLNEGEGAFYGPKIDFHIKDCLGRTWQCATIQLDFSMPEKFDLKYEGKDGKKNTPVMIHRAIYGSIERFLAILIEHFGGKFPLWLAPLQVKILTVTDRNVDFAKQLQKDFIENNIRIELDDRAETISKKVRDAQVEKINYIVTVGDKEVKNKTLAVRTLDGKVNFNVEPNKFMQELIKEVKDKKC